MSSLWVSRWLCSGYLSARAFWFCIHPQHTCTHPCTCATHDCVCEAVRSQRGRGVWECGVWSLIGCELSLSPMVYPFLVLLLLSQNVPKTRVKPHGWARSQGGLAQEMGLTRFAGPAPREGSVPCPGALPGRATQSPTRRHTKLSFHTCSVWKSSPARVRPSPGWQVKAVWAFSRHPVSSAPGAVGMLGCLSRLLEVSPNHGAFLPPRPWTGVSPPWGALCLLVANPHGQSQ